MKIPSTNDIINEVKELKSEMQRHDFQMGIGGIHEKEFFNKINKILRMLECPTRRVDLKSFKKERKELAEKRFKEKHKAYLKAQAALNRLRSRN